MTGIVRDVRHGFRGFVRNPGFTFTAVLSLALGIGANSALFGMFNSLLWKPLPVEAPDELVVLYSRRDAQSFYQSFSYPEYLDYRAATGVFAGVVAYTPTELSLRTQGRDDAPAFGELVSGNYFDVLGVRMALGRGFLPEEDAEPGSRPVVVLGHRLWERRFDAGPSVVGRPITLNGQPFTIVGVAADGKCRQLTETPRPFAFFPTSLGPSRTLVVHLRDGADVASAVAAVRRAVQAVDPAMPIFDVKTMDQFMERAYLGPKLAAYLIGPAGVLALVIAAIGLYGVMACWVGQRTREVGIRVAIGARPADILRLVMGQGLTLAGIGLALGLAGAFAVSRVVASLLFGVSPTDPLVFAGVPVVLAAVATLASWVPARRALKVDPLFALRAE